MRGPFVRTHPLRMPIGHLDLACPQYNGTSTSQGMAEELANLCVHSSGGCIKNPKAHLLHLSLGLLVLAWHLYAPGHDRVIGQPQEARLKQKRKPRQREAREAASAVRIEKDGRKSSLQFPYFVRTQCRRNALSRPSPQEGHESQLSPSPKAAVQYESNGTCSFPCSLLGRSCHTGRTVKLRMIRTA